MVVSAIIATIGQFTVLAGLSVAAGWDIAKRLIPNEVVAVVALGGVLIWLGADQYQAIWMRVGAAAMVFIALRVLSGLRSIGGGDAKLISAVILGLPIQAVLPVLGAIAIAGGVLALGYLFRNLVTVHLERSARLALPEDGTPPPPSRFPLSANWNLEMPYAPAILAGVLWQALGKFA